jgi:hypothetical protein
MKVARTWRRLRFRSPISERIVATKAPQALLALGVLLTIVWTGGLAWLLMRLLAFI